MTFNKTLSSVIINIKKIRYTAIKTRTIAFFCTLRVHFERNLLVLLVRKLLQRTSLGIPLVQHKVEYFSVFNFIKLLTAHETIIIN